MILDGIDYGRVWSASGARGFFGEGYWFHSPLRPFGLDWRGSTFVAKTTTMEPRAGNMPLVGTRPREWKPKCIEVNFRRGAVLNAVGLSGPGLVRLLADGRWQARTEPFVLSFAAVSVTPEDRRTEVEEFADWLDVCRDSQWRKLNQVFCAPFALEVNASCPNTGHDPAALMAEVATWLDLFRDHLPGVPLLPKINALVPVDAARELAFHDACDGLVVSNTIPWTALEDMERRRTLGIITGGILNVARAAFGRVSPLAHLGGGGISGAPLFYLVHGWVTEAVSSGFPVPIVAGGGILSSRHATLLLTAGASAVELGSVAILRPWRVRGIIRFINRRQSHG